ncbi:glycine zipper 2TM domain-containing protein [Undibacterium terreum]|uniref:Glycine zipper 2TM domain-containing protein n=1 Tax=Undibacterium terreum TaxID=1224302 RepID=A0A916UZ35_9BURK|nr:glycine zipper 2TM domain-containing protein [Undibacterium terreum]GGC95099.1 hypothetical protein GCM10011396_48050 [Undibacterium terreum]
MENNQSRRIHPLVAGAAVSVTLVSLIGVAAITGILPNSLSKSGPVDQAALQNATMSQPQNAQNAQDGYANAPQAGQKNGQAYVDNAPNDSGNSRNPQGQPYTSQVAQANPEYRNAAPAAESRPAVCKHCGRVDSIQAVQHQAQTSGLGVAAGAVLGGVLGHQVGHGNGNTLATVAGAVGGGYAGNEVEKRRNTTTTYIVKVRMDDGKVRSFPQDGWRVGDRVREVNGKLESEG